MGFKIKVKYQYKKKMKEIDAFKDEVRVRPARNPILQKIAEKHYS